MDYSRKKEIRIKADDFRRSCKVSNYGIIDLFHECERLRYKLIRYPLGEGQDLGFALKRDNDIVIFTNTSSRLSREIFTLAHELGHVILHLDNAASFIDNSVTTSGRTTDSIEQEANYFAASLLMPDDEVRKFFDLELEDYKKNGLSAMDIARLMSEFNVSFDMALNRLENLGIIDFNQHQLLDNEKNEKRVGNLLRSVGGNAKLNEASNVIDLPYEFIEYAIYNYNHYAIPQETLLRVLAYYELTMDDISDRLVSDMVEDDEDIDLDELIGGLDD